MYHCLPVPRGNWPDPFDLHALRMVLIHNVMIRAYNSQLYYAAEVQPGTKKFTSFVAYCATMNHYLHHHHWLEETYWFPFLDEKIGNQCMQDNIDEHKDIMEKFDVYEDLIKELQADPSTFNLTEFRDSIHSFLPELIEHLRSEPDTFRPDTLRKYIPREELDACDKAMEKEVMASFSLVDDIPLFFMNGDSKNAPWFPPLPTVIGLVTKQVLYWVHLDVWAFGATDRYMKVKPEFAAYEPDLEQEAKAL